VSQWLRYQTPSWDLGIFTQLARRYAHLQAPIVDVKGDGYNLLGDHFHPLLVLLGLPYRIWPSALTVLLVQAVLLAFSMWVVTRAAVHRLGAIPGSLVGVAYGLSFGIVEAVVAQFHEIAFAVPLLALSLVALLDRRWLAAALWAAPLVLVKEDLGVTVAVLGALVAWRGRDEGPRPGRVGAALAAWGMAWFALTTRVLLPALNPDGQFAYAGKVDVAAVARQPWLGVVHLVDDGTKLATLALLALACGLVGLRSPLMLAALPTLAWRFWSPDPVYWGPKWHYSAVLMPIAAVALLDGIELAGRSPRGWLRRVGEVAVAVCVTAAVALTPQLGFAQLGRASFWQPNLRAAAAQRLLDEVPAGVTVETDVGLMSYLVDTRDVYWFGNVGNPAPDWLVFDSIWGGGAPRTPEAVLDWAAEHHPGVAYRVVFDEDGYLAARRTGP